MMTPLTPKQTQELVGFIRTVLGCGCPDEVLADLKLTKLPSAFSGLPVDLLLKAGGRLLVALCFSHSEPIVESRLKRCFETGRRMRDEEGFNRFRFVAAVSDPVSAAPALHACFDNLRDRDDRLHLHVVSPLTLPDFLS